MTIIKNEMKLAGPSLFWVTAFVVSGITAMCLNRADLVDLYAIGFEVILPFYCAIAVCIWSKGRSDDMIDMLSAHTRSLPLWFFRRYLMVFITVVIFSLLSMGMLCLFARDADFIKMVVAFLPTAFFLSSFAALTISIISQSRLALSIVGIVWLFLLFTRSAVLQNSAPWILYLYPFETFSGANKYILLISKAYLCIGASLIWIIIWRIWLRKNSVTCYISAGLLTVCLLSVMLIPATHYAGMLTGPQKLEEVKYLCIQLENRHHDLYAAIDKSLWETNKKKLIDSVGTMNDRDYFYAISELAASIHDAHTRTNKNTSGYNLLPLKGEYFDDGLHLIAAAEPYTQYLGNRIIAIDSVDINRIRLSMARLISYDTDAYLNRQFAETFIDLDALVYLGIVNSNKQATITFEDMNGLRRDVNVFSVTTKLNSTHLKNINRSHEPYAEQTDKAYYSSQVGSDTLFIAYNDCKDDPNFPMKSFVEQISQTVSKMKFPKIIIDLRRNAGGNSSVLAPLIDYLASMDSLKTYVLIGNNTFSSAVINAFELKQKTGAVLVGRPTGGSLNHYGEIGKLVLNYSGIEISYSTKHFVFDKTRGQGSLLPDIYAKNSFIDYLNGIDPELSIIIS